MSLKLCKYKGKHYIWIAVTHNYQQINFAAQTFKAQLQYTDKENTPPQQVLGLKFKKLSFKIEKTKMVCAVAGTNIFQAL